MDYPAPILLKYPYHLNPTVLNDLRRGHTAIVTDPARIIIHQQEFIAESPLPVGEHVRIRAASYTAEAYRQTELDAYTAWRQAEKERIKKLDDQRRAEKAQRRRQASDAFYSNNPIPFAFSIEIKEVLSGLSANSWGDGQKRNTVYHIYTQEPIAFGRLKRPKGEFLCSPVSSRSGANWSDSLGKDTHRLDSDGVRQIPTCKQCLAILERLNAAR